MTRVALVTGATSGIGAEVARRFAGAGLKVMATGRDQERGRTLAGELGAERCAFRAAELGRAEVADRLVAETVDHFGGLDVLVNSAGFIQHADALETSDEL